MIASAEGIAYAIPKKRTPREIEHLKEINLREFLDRASALTVQLVTTHKRLVNAIGCRGSYASAVRAGRGPVAVVTRIIFALGREAWVLLEHFEITLLDSLMVTHSKDELVRLYHRITRELEPDAECAENKAVIARDLEELEQADLMKAALHRERAVLLRQMRRLGIDPYDNQRRA